jgi:hypothetical protein
MTKIHKTKTQHNLYVCSIQRYDQAVGASIMFCPNQKNKDTLSFSKWVETEVNDANVKF